VEATTTAGGQGSPGPDDEVWCVVDPRTGRTINGPFGITDARAEAECFKFYNRIVARWDAEGLRWIEAPAPTIMVELPVSLARAMSHAASICGDACRAALEREGIS